MSPAEDKGEAPSSETVVVELFVQGQSPRSTAALDIVQRVCESRLKGRYRLEIIDIQQQPERTRCADIIAAPALIRRVPEPILRTVGRFSEARVLRGLGLAGAPGEAGYG